MTNHEALELLRAQGYAVSAPDSSGKIRIWIEHTDASVVVAPGPELWDLAEGKITPAELLEREPHEIATAGR